MTDKAGFFAGCADILTEMCVYYVVAAIMIMSGRGWGLHLGWLLLCAAVCAWIFARTLRKPRTTPFLTALTAVLFIAVMAVFLLASATPPTFGYVFVLAVGGGMAVGMPLYYGLHRPDVYRHLTHLDVLILALLGLLLCREALGIDGGTVALMVAVLFMDAAGAVGLRMTEGGGADSANAFKAAMVALCAAVGVFLVIGLLTMLFSRGGGLTGSVLRGIGGFFAAIGAGIERFFIWFSGLFRREEQFEAIPLEGELPSVADAELEAGGMELSVNTTAVGIGLCVVIAAAAIVIAAVMRKKTFSRGTKTAPAASDTVVRRSDGTLRFFWQRLKAALRFRWTAFRLRNTPGGLLVTLERVGKRRRVPRQTGEPMGHYIRRVDGSGGLDPLADTLDREYYGGGGQTMSPKRCRELRRYMRKVVRHG